LTNVACNNSIIYVVSEKIIQYQSITKHDWPSSHLEFPK